jgi:DNA-binding MarR family transcriptional regulator
MLDPGADHLRAIEENDLSVSQVRALMVLACAAEPVPGARLAERLGFSPAAVSRALDGLVRDGLAVRTESAEDRRVRPFAATDRGRELADELSALRRAQLDRFVERLDPGQREALAAAMDLIVGEVGA